MPVEAKSKCKQVLNMVTESDKHEKSLYKELRWENGKIKTLS